MVTRTAWPSANAMGSANSMVLPWMIPGNVIGVMTQHLLNQLQPTSPLFPLRDGRWRRSGRRAGGSAASDIDVVLLDRGGVFGRQIAAHCLADQFALAGRQVEEVAVTADVVELRTRIGNFAVGRAV